MTEDEMVGWHHQLNEHEFEQAPGVCAAGWGNGSKVGGKSPFAWFSSGQFSRSVVSDSLQPHGLQHARLPCPSPTPRAYSNSYPLSW